MSTTCCLESPTFSPGRAIIGDRLRTIRQPGSVLGAKFARVVTLPYDSRERIQSPEQQLAAWGVRWDSNPAYDLQLVRELELSGRCRHAQLACCA